MTKFPLVPALGRLRTGDHQLGSTRIDPRFSTHSVALGEGVTLAFFRHTGQLQIDQRATDREGDGGLGEAPPSEEYDASLPRDDFAYWRVTRTQNQRQNTAMYTEVGRLVGLSRYPVKSMGGEPLDSADVSWHGVVGDRRWAFVRAGVERSGFPWLTIRERPDMNAYQPRFIDPARPDSSPVQVRTASGTEHHVLAPELGDDLGHGARVIKQDRGVFDTFPLSLISTQTVAGLSALVGAELDVRRFRPNLVVEASGGGPFPEDDWVGSSLKIGSLTFRVDKRDGRCAVVNVDPTSGRRDPAVLRAIASERSACAGVYGSTVEPGRVAVGDVVYVVR